MANSKGVCPFATASGQDYQCQEDCPLWIKTYGLCSFKVIAIGLSPDNNKQLIELEQEATNEL